MIGSFTQRLEVVQKNKVRGCDSATSNLINKTAVITEKLQLPSTDLNVAVLRELRTGAGDRRLQAWVLDERKPGLSAAADLAATSQVQRDLPEEP